LKPIAGRSWPLSRIILNVRTEDDKQHYDLAAEEPVMLDSEAILRQENHGWFIRSSLLDWRMESLSDSDPGFG